MTMKSGLRFLEDRWDDAIASTLDGPELLRYRSNLLGSDLRITNFGGGNTSSKIERSIPLTEEKAGSLGEGQRGAIWAVSSALALPRCIWKSCWRWRTSTAAWSSRTRWWGCIRCARFGTTPSRLRSIRRCMDFCRLRMSIICTRTGASRWRPRPTASKDGRVQP